MKRTKNVELLRALAILYVMFYHFYVVSGKHVPGRLMSELLHMGGEIGATMFFVISGFGVFMLLSSREYSYGAFLKSRIRKLVPEYYLCLGVLLLLTGQSVYLCMEQIPNLLSHAVFLHSLVPAYSGAINGVLWTMGVLVQFYVLAHAIFRLMKKSVVYPIVLIMLSLAVKWLMFHVILPQVGVTDSIYYFVFGRQIYTALDNFLVGMLVAECIRKGYVIKEKLAVILLIVAILILGCWAVIGFRSGIYYDTLISYVWHFVAAAICGVLIYLLCVIRELKWIWLRPLHWVAKYNYGIYLWHLVLCNTLLQYCAWAQRINYLLFAVIMTGLSCIAGCVSGCFGKCLVKAQ